MPRLNSAVERAKYLADQRAAQAAQQGSSSPTPSSLAEYSPSLQSSGTSSPASSQSSWAIRDPTPDTPEHDSNTLQRNIGAIMDDEFGAVEQREPGRWRRCVNRSTSCIAHTPTIPKIMVILLVGSIVGGLAMHWAAPAAAAGAAGHAAAGHAAAGITATEVEALIAGHALGDLVTHEMFEQAHQRFEHMGIEEKKKILFYVLGKIISFLIKQQLSPRKFEGDRAAADMIEAILQCKPFNLEIDRITSVGDLFSPILGLDIPMLETLSPHTGSAATQGSRPSAAGGGYIKGKKTKRNRKKTKSKSILKYKN